MFEEPLKNVAISPVPARIKTGTYPYGMALKLSKPWSSVVPVIATLLIIAIVAILLYYEAKKGEKMIQTIICDRCKKPIRPPDATRIGMAISADPMSIVHIPGYDGAYADRFAYADLCPKCATKFNKFMEGDHENGNE